MTTNISYKGLMLNFLVNIKRGGTLLSRVTGDLRRTGTVAETAELPRFGAERSNPTAPSNLGREHGGHYQPAVLVEFVQLQQPRHVRVRRLVDAPARSQPDVRVAEKPSQTHAVQRVFGRSEWPQPAALDESAHIDPEVNVGSNPNVQGIEFNTLPQARTYGVVLRALF